jgi:hypothetical protein
MEIKLFTIQEAAKLLKRSKSTLYKWRMDGIGPKSRMKSGAIYYTSDALFQFLKKDMEKRVAEKRPERAPTRPPMPWIGAAPKRRESREEQRQFAKELHQFMQDIKKLR